MNSQEEFTLYAVAVSVTSTRSVSDLYRMLEGSNPVSLFGMIEEKTKPEVQDYLKDLYGENPVDAAQRILEKAHSLDIQVIHYWHSEYPRILKKIFNPPVVLYCRGKIKNRKSLALVGSRKADVHSRNICRNITGDLSKAGFNIVSGMAVGIDREAHMTALDVDGTTTAVLANGIDRMYPKDNIDLYERIVQTEGSVLVSEYPPGAIAGRWTFVRRNRIISGLSLGTIVVKAAVKSGALITAGYALEQNRELFVCPGNAFDKDYEGCIQLLKNGAVPVFNTDDITEVFVNSRITPLDSQMLDFFSDGGEESLEKKIVVFLESEKLDIDTVVRKTGAHSGDVNNAVMSLELKGLVSRNGNYIELIRTNF